MIRLDGRLDGAWKVQQVRVVWSVHAGRVSNVSTNGEALVRSRESLPLLLYRLQLHWIVSVAAAPLSNLTLPTASQPTPQLCGYGATLPPQR